MRAINELVEFLVSGGIDLGRQLSPTFWVDRPLCQRNTGVEALHGLRDWSRSVGMELHCVHRVQSENRVALEFDLELRSQSELQTQGETGRISLLPIAVMVDLRGELIEAMRVYHSLWGLEGEHRVRPALFDLNDCAELPTDVKQYHQALFQGSTDQVMKLFEPGGYTREPSGDRYGRRYDRALIDFFSHAFANGGVTLSYHTLIETPEFCAAEYTCYEWGHQAIPPQAGMEFWDRAPSGLFQAIRIYDDVAQPSN